MIRQTIKAEMTARKETPAKLARAIGVHTAPLYNFFNGKAGLSFNILEKVLKHYDLVLIKIYEI